MLEVIMEKPKKITVDVDEKVLKSAQDVSGEGISETVRLALKLLGSAGAFEKALNLRGKVRFSKTWKELKEDR